MKKARLDRRVEKTRSALFGAFAGLVQKHRYEDIGVADILERATSVGQLFMSTFPEKRAFWLAASLALSLFLRTAFGPTTTPQD